MTLIRHPEIKRSGSEYQTPMAERGGGVQLPGEGGGERRLDADDFRQKRRRGWRCGGLARAALLVAAALWIPQSAGQQEQW
jgi:hypothetical protein